MKKCKNCGGLFKPFNTLQKYCSSKCTNEGEKESKKQQEAKKKTRESNARKCKLDVAQITFNAYIRERDKGKPCICCGKPLKGNFHAGHFFSVGGHSAVRFSEDNVHGQLAECNTGHNIGTLERMGVNVEERIGVHRMELLRSEAYEVKKWEITELDSIIKEYRKKIVTLKSEI